jgi:hypothetical protein
LEPESGAKHVAATFKVWRERLDFVGFSR